MRTTYMAKPSEVERKWYIIDAAGKTLGKLSTEAATILRGKHKPTYTPNVDCGDHVIVINASEVVLTGNKLDQKTYYHHSRFVGGLKTMPYRELLSKKPELAVEHAIKGMLPHNRLGRQMYKKLNVYRGSEHPHQAQKPENLG
ncbi:LSU ribosomal protein L13P [Desulfonispora thiosulfatigenes DSM 11270]|uniref:Large ribosomal subunit protein uL13 n=1 Tax=Desulfonispora thiosulfatigenes DSM 11270 TaxID=656914 RepID=A0A1W1UR98_DESTI|nr:50S ribosomal protein L13 [Desulfonispora thiosulfatigenes]SMB83617.1 LSU ribosomal protein L13P [Desulfonispora thiosulfatigenes DSM 11270]